ncbi:ABC transporter ATP-binding protein [Clostridium perfringens]|uniref:ABC transporter ATP-binding protein n=1 Tax=Clostridium perfringens TaxID=1502 RepID=UPI0026E3468B|nr:ABC transporter ATP-binding protein [Clostridium perfringens]EJT5932203.1 ABC transporter ATP-binding protein [Clostridium perfringens]EJT6163468.1 ABC transporter ATP-binding protein [Clostridium perfringens]EJT6505952.1 ABC transporter ATP-binding protein [Clostridium perfringens]MDO6234005.1 ABC transporter ATP-binding protein [Clostridium perfringens]MDZ5022891.1 ATP-binding cassette domain-containing protein [Clostridium perfringens]
MLEICNLNKSFDGKKILSNINLNVNYGEIYGIIGPNGAGKTTLLNSIIGLYKLDSGKIKFNKKELIKPYEVDIKKIIGFIPDNPILFEYLSGYENLEFFSRLNGNNFSFEECNILLEEFNIKTDANKLVKNFSKGMKQKLMLISTIMNNSKLIILDEPTTGLDPISILELKNKIKFLKNKDLILIIATHDMNFLEEICDRVAIIVNGKLLAQDTPTNLYKKTNTNSLEKVLWEMVGR